MEKRERKGNTTRDFRDFRILMENFNLKDITMNKKRDSQVP